MRSSSIELLMSPCSLWWLTLSTRHSHGAHRDEGWHTDASLVHSWDLPGSGHVGRGERLLPLAL